MLGKNFLISLAILSTAIIFQLGFQRWFYSILALVTGFVVAHAIQKVDFQLPSLFPQNNDKFKLETSENKTTTRQVLKSSASSTSLSSQDGVIKRPRQSDVSFETLFKKSHPWQSVYIPDNVDKSIEKLLSLIIQNYILIWYNQISADDGFIFELKCLFRHILSNLIIRLKNIDLNHLFTYKLNTLLYNHINDFHSCYSKTNLIDLNSRSSLEERLSKQHEIFKIICELRDQNNSGCHYALISRKHELAYLRQISKTILPYLLPDSVNKNKLSCELIQEVFVSNILINGLDVIAEPDTINKLIINIIKSHNNPEEKRILNNKYYVQPLYHWCQMNGSMYKTIAAPSFKEIIENNEILHIFINYLNTLNSLSVLQLYLMLRDMEKNQEESGGESNLNTNIHELKAWSMLKTNKLMLETITFDFEHTYLDKINNLLDRFDSGDESDRILAKKLISDVKTHLCNLLRDIYYNSFVKSEFMYKNLLGLNKVVNGSCLLKNKMTKSQTSSSLSSFKNNKKNESTDSKETSSLIVENDLFENDSAMVDDDTEDSYFQTFYSNKNQPENEDNDIDDEDDYENLDSFISGGGGGGGGDDSLMTKSGCEVRLDLINEIKDEFLDDELNDKTSPNNAVDGINKFEENNEDDEDEEEEEDDENERSSFDNINLNHLRVCIDEIEQLVDKSNKTCYVFVIQVWNVKSGIEKSSMPPNWSVKRKYDEFYVLDNRLKEFHGGLIKNSESNEKNNQITAQLPNKQRALFFTSNSRNIEYLNTVREDFAKYLQSLLNNPILAMSQLLKSFLDPQSIEFSSSMFNDISNLGKMVKRVPYKLRLERGQSLEPFLQSLFQLVKSSKPKPSKTTPLEDSLDLKLKNKLFENPSKNSDSNSSSNTSLSNLKRNSFTEKHYVTPFDSLLCLIGQIYKLPSYICLTVFSLGKILQNTFNSLTFWVVSKKVNDLTTPESIEEFIDLFREVLFEPQSIEQIPSETFYNQAFTSLNEFIFKDLLGFLTKSSLVSAEKLKPGVEEGTRLFLESFQYPIWNKDLTYQLLDALIEELFPELDEQIVDK